MCSVLVETLISKKVANSGNGMSKSEKTLFSQMGKRGGARASTSKGSRIKNSLSSVTECFYCHEKGHFKMDYPKYRIDLVGGKLEIERYKGLLVINIKFKFSHIYPGLGR